MAGTPARLVHARLEGRQRRAAHASPVEEDMEHDGIGVGRGKEPRAPAHQSLVKGQQPVGLAAHDRGQTKKPDTGDEQPGGSQAP